MADPRGETPTRRGAPRARRPGCLLGSILWGIAGFLLLLIVFPNCEVTSRQARMARALSQERLAGMHLAMTKLWATIPEDERNIASVSFSGEQIPKEFGGLNARFVRIRGGHSIIRLQGCFDHHQDLIFYGVGEPTTYGDHSPRIDLHSGEHDVTVETLWRPASAGQSPETGK